LRRSYRVHTQSSYPPSTPSAYQSLLRDFKVSVSHRGDPQSGYGVFSEEQCRLTCAVATSNAEDSRQMRALPEAGVRLWQIIRRDSQTLNRVSGTFLSSDRIATLYADKLRFEGLVQFVRRDGLPTSKFHSRKHKRLLCATHPTTCIPQSVFGIIICASLHFVTTRLHSVIKLDHMQLCVYILQYEQAYYMSEEIVG
jgi:hypothetical protein